MCALVLAQARKLTPMDLLFLEKAAVHLLPHLSLPSLPFQSIPLKEFDRNQFCVSRKWIIYFRESGLLFFSLQRKPNNTKKAFSLFDTLGGPHVRSSFTEHICGCTSDFLSFIMSLLWKESRNHSFLHRFVVRVQTWSHSLLQWKSYA